MAPSSKRTSLGLLILLAGLLATVVGVLSGASALARTRQQVVASVPLLTMAPGSFAVSLGQPPSWLPLAGTPESLTLIAGTPTAAHASADNAYVGFLAAGRRCAATPAASRAPYVTFPAFYSRSHSAASTTDSFAPDGGAARATSLASVPGVVIHQANRARACIWLAPTPGTASRARHARGQARSLVASLIVPLLNRTFAASISNLPGSAPATPGTGPAAAGPGAGASYSMDAFAAGHGFRYSATTSRCEQTTTDAPTAVAAASPASETVSLSASPCSDDASVFHFSGPGVNVTLSYPAAGALAAPTAIVHAGACELDPLTAVPLATAERYLTAVGCRLGRVEISPFRRSAARGTVAWAAIDGAVAEIAPLHTAVDLILNGRP